MKKNEERYPYYQEIFLLLINLEKWNSTHNCATFFINTTDKNAITNNTKTFGM